MARREIKGIVEPFLDMVGCSRRTTRSLSRRSSPVAGGTSMRARSPPRPILSDEATSARSIAGPLRRSSGRLHKRINAELDQTICSHQPQMNLDEEARAARRRDEQLLSSAGTTSVLSRTRRMQRQSVCSAKSPTAATFRNGCRPSCSADYAPGKAVIRIANTGPDSPTSRSPLQAHERLQRRLRRHHGQIEIFAPTIRSAR